MAFKYVDRVLEVSSSTGTGDIVLGGAPATYRAFSAAFVADDTTDVTIFGAGAFEVCRATFKTGPNRIVRGTVHASSNGGSPVNFGAGEKTALVCLPAMFANPDAFNLQAAYAAVARQWEDSRGWPSHGGMNFIAVPGLPLPAAINFTRAGVAWDWGPNGDLVEYSPNAIRHAYDPVTRKYLGWRYSRVARTNYITGTNMAAVVPGSPGTPPSGWAPTGSTDGITRTIALGALRGAPAIDYRMAGTASATHNRYPFGGQSMAVPVTVGAPVTFSGLIQLIAGDLGAITSVNVEIQSKKDNLTQNTAESDGGLTSVNLKTDLSTGQIQSFAITKTVSHADTVWCEARIRCVINNAAVVDATLRLALMQVQISSVATAPIVTGAAAVTVPAEVMNVTIPDSLWSNEQMVLLMRGSGLVNSPGTIGLLGFDLGGDGNYRCVLDVVGGGSRLVVVNAGIAQAVVSAGSISGPAPFMIAGGVAADNFSIANNGGTPLTDMSGTVPALSKTLKVGYYVGGLEPVPEMAISQFGFIPARFNNADIQKISRLDRL